MHTYRTSAKAGKSGFQVGTGSGAGGQHFDAIGPHFEKEAEAAAFAAYMNGGRYEPDAIAEIMKPAEEEREKLRKEREEQSKREQEAEKARQKAEYAKAHPQEQPDTEDEPKDNDRAKAKQSKAFAARRHHEVKRSRKHK